MKMKILTMVMFVAVVAFLSGCAEVQKTNESVTTPEVKKAEEPKPEEAKKVEDTKKAEEPTTPAKTENILGLYITKDSEQMSGVSADTIKLAVDESVKVYVRGKGEGDKWIKLPADAVVTWKADSELEITPNTGQEITIKVVKPISVVSYATASMTTPDGKTIKVDCTIIGKK